MNKLKNIPIDEYEIATFALGTPWKVEEVYRNKARGIISTATGYTGDEVQYPRFERVKEERKDLVHAVQIIFDPKLTSYEKLLELFWELHDPAYALKTDEESNIFRSIIYYHSEKQKEKAIISCRKYQRSEKCKGQMNTQILPAMYFYEVVKEKTKSNNNTSKKMGINKSFPPKGLQHQAR